MRNPTLVQSFLVNIAMKLAPVAFVFSYYFTDNFNEGGITLKSSDLVWISCMVLAFFLSE